MEIEIEGIDRFSDNIVSLVKEYGGPSELISRLEGDAIEEINACEEENQAPEWIVVKRLSKMYCAIML